MSTQHKNLSTSKIHIPYNWSYANKTAREAATGFVAADVGKLAVQTDDYSLWVLTDDSPITWVRVSGGYPKAATMWHDQSLVISGNAIRKSVNTSQRYNIYSDQNTPANGNVSENGFLIAAGTYTLRFLGVTSTDGGKLDITIDGGSVLGTLDFYSGSTVFNAEFSISSVVIASDGYHKLTMTVNGKNASSSDYHCYITKMWLEPSAY